MQKSILILALGLFIGTTAGQNEHPPRPRNCTETFDHSYSLDELLDQFRDDDIRMNMSKASPVFWSHPDLTIEYIYDALNHEDWQVRQIICNAIWRKTTDREVWTPISSPGHDWKGVEKHFYPADPNFKITEDLIRVTIEGLRHDTTPYDWDRKRGLVIYNASSGISRLIPIAHEWIDLLNEAMESDDHQQRLLAAYILGRAGIAQSVERASEILLPHLRDNKISEDAKFCVFGLGGFGEELLPYLSAALPEADQQQRDLILLLMMNIKDPPTNQDNLQTRSRYNSITSTVYDPASQYPPGPMRWLNELQD